MTQFVETKLHCVLSGLQIGTLQFMTTAGTAAYLSHWNGLVAKHPVFSMEYHKLFKFARHEWERLAQRAEDESISEAESDILRVTFLALLHSLGSIKQDDPGLPDLSTVQSNMEALLHLAGWKFYLESQRFQFPTLHICKFNRNQTLGNVKDYLDVCFELRKEYATKVRAKEEAAKVAIAEEAAKQLTSSWAKPVSKKLLWTWVQSHLPEKYKVDSQNWMATIFLGGKLAIVGWELEDIDLLEEIILSECPLGTGVMPAVRARLDEIRKIWKEYNSDFEFDLADFSDNAGMRVNGELVAEPDPGPEPQQSEFTSKSQYYVARGKWFMAKAAFDKYQKALAAKTAA